MTPVAERRISEADFAYLQSAIATTSALLAAQRYDVFALLEDQPVDPQSLAQQRGLTERGAALLLRALAAVGVAEVTEDARYSPAIPDLSVVVGLLDMWGALPGALRDGTAFFAGDSPVHSGAAYAEVIPMLGEVFEAAAERAADILAPVGGRVLDVGAGAAPWSIALALRQPLLKVTALDLPEVMPAAERAVAAADVEACFDYIVGDVLTADLGTDYDLVIAANVCHLFDEGRNRLLLDRLSWALRPGGRLAVVDAVLNERMDGPRDLVLYSLGLILRTRCGQVYPYSTYISWLREAGLRDIARSEVSSALPLTLITATKE